MTAAEFRRLALGLEGAEEGARMGHPDFRVRGRTFASLHAGDASGMVKLAPEERQALVHEHPGTFAPASGAWGRQGCTLVRLPEADAATVRGALLLAWQRIGEARTARTRPAQRKSPRRIR